MNKMIRAFHTFRGRLMLTTLFYFALIVLCVVWLASRQYSRFMLDQSQQTTWASFRTAEDQLTSVLNDAALVTADIQRRAIVDGYVLNEYGDDVERILARKELLSTLDDAFLLHDSLYGVLFLRGDGTLFGATRQRSVFLEAKAQPIADDPRIAAAQRMGVEWIGAYRLRDFVPDASAKAGEKALLCGIQRLHYSLSYTSETVDAIALVLLDEDVLQKTFGYLESPGETLCLLDGDNRQIAGGAQADHGLTPRFALDIALPSAREGSMTVRDASANEAVQLIYRRLATGGMTLIKRVPMRLYTSEITALGRAICFISLGVFVLIGGIYLLWTKRFARAFGQIGRALEQMRGGDLSVRMPVDSDIYEFSLIGAQFNSMADSLQNLITYTRDMEHERLEMELRNLQTQLNPHMIFNSITAIRWTATFLGAGEVSGMLAELAELLRPIFSEWRMSWTLGEELEYTAHYMKLLRLRYGTNLVTDISVPDELRLLYVPRFTLQPILENSCEHGAMPSKAISIQLEASVSAQSVLLRVKDNGRGMSHEMLQTLRDKLCGRVDDSVAFGRGSIGLYNVHRRIQLFCGDSYGLTIDSKENEGTCVTVALLCKREP